MVDQRLLIALCLLSACGRCDERAVMVASPSASASQSARAPTAPLPPGPWQEAEDDELAAQRLGLMHEARVLLRVARDHPSHAAAALRALSHAVDAELALAGLALLARSSDALRTLSLATLVALSRRRPLDERLDPDGIAQCMRALDAMSRDRAIDAPSRALAVSALRGFARAGFVDPAAITTELDPPP